MDSTTTKNLVPLPYPDKQEFDSNIKIACNLILTHLREEMRNYEEEIDQIDPNV